MNRLTEGLELGDLKRLIKSELHVDEFKSKLGSDQDICVLSFKVAGKDPAQDLVNYIEKGYSWVVDADVSSGEMDDGDYIVFVEAERTEELPAQVISMITDILNLTEQSLTDWIFKYHGQVRRHPVTEQDFASVVPLTPESYRKEYPDNKELDSLKTAAGVNVDTKAPKNEFTEAIRIAAGIR
jgi:hypothetical protein